MAYPDSFPNIQYSSGGDINAIPEVQRLLGDPSGLTYTNTKVQYWLDRGASEAARLSKLLEGGVAYITLTTGTKIYSFPSDLYSAPQDVSVEIESLFYTNVETATPQTAATGYALAKVDMRMLQNLDNQSAGAPYYWAVRNTDNNSRSIYIYPAPSSDHNNHMVEIHYYKAANYYKAADSSTSHTLPEYLREIVFWYAVSEAYRSKGLIAIAEMYRKFFENMVIFHRQDKHPKPVDSQDMWRLPDYTQYAS